MKKIQKVSQRFSRVAKIKNLQSKFADDHQTEEYSRGLYNGLELALSVLLDRQPNFKD